MTLLVQEIVDSRTFRVGSFTIQVVPQNCQVRVTSWDWQEMNGENAWWHHGRESIWHFIADMGQDPHYAMKKLFCGRELREIDEDATEKAIMAEAKTFLDVEKCDEVQEYLERCSDEGFGDVPHFQCSYEYIVYKEKWCCQEFRKMWPVFCQYVKEAVIPNLPKEVT